MTAIADDKTWFPEWRWCLMASPQLPRARSSQHPLTIIVMPPVPRPCSVVETVRIQRVREENRSACQQPLLQYVFEAAIAQEEECAE